MDLEGTRRSPQKSHQVICFMLFSQDHYLVHTGYKKRKKSWWDFRGKTWKGFIVNLLGYFLTQEQLKQPQFPQSVSLKPAEKNCICMNKRCSKRWGMYCNHYYSFTLQQSSHCAFNSTTICFSMLLLTTVNQSLISGFIIFSRPIFVFSQELCPGPAPAAPLTSESPSSM